MTSTDDVPTPTNDPGSFSSFRSTLDYDRSVESYQSDATPPIHTSRRHVRIPSRHAPLASSQSPNVARNPSPPPSDNNLSRADMVGDEMYSKSWFCHVLLKLIQFVVPEQLHDEIFATIRQHGDQSLTLNTSNPQDLDESFESELCELWDISMSADVAHLLIEHKSLDLFNVVLMECKDKRCIEIVLGILSNMACCKRSLIQDNGPQTIALCIAQHSNLLGTILSMLTSDDYSDCPSLIQLFRLIYTLFVRQETRALMFEHVQLAYEPLCFILQSCCNQELLEQCSYLLRILFDECHLFEHNEQNEVAFLFLTSISTAIGTLMEKDASTDSVCLENLFNCLQIYTTYEHCLEMLNEHCQLIMNLMKRILHRLAHDDIVQIRSVLLLSCLSICNFYLDKHGLKIFDKQFLEYFLIIAQTCYKDRQRREHQKHAERRRRSRTHSTSSNKKKDADDITGDNAEHSSKHRSPPNETDWNDTVDDSSASRVDLDRSTSEDLCTMSYSLIDQLFLELFHRGIREESSPSIDGLPSSTSIFAQLSHDQRELFRKIIKHFCNLDKRLDDMLDL